MWAVLLHIATMVPYYRDVFRGRTTPHPYSYWVWSVLTAISAGILLWNREIWASIPAICEVITNIWLLLLSFYFSKNIPINWFDKLCLFLAFLSLFYGIMSGNFFQTIALVILVDALWYMPTYKKAWLLPWSETIISNFIASIKYLFILLSLQSFSFENSWFWIYLLIANMGLFCMALARRYYLKWWKSIFE